MAQTVARPRGAALRERRRRRTADDLERTALQLFAERGFRSVTVDEIAAAADVSPRTFFRYFPAKEDVLFADVRRRVEQLHTALAERPLDEAPMEAVRHAFLAMAAAYDADREVALLWSSIVADTPELANRLSGLPSEYQAGVTALVANRLGVNAASDLRPRIIAGATLSASFVAYEQWLAGGAKGRLTTLVAEALDVLESPATWVAAPKRRKPR
jgi:AcrR family transcriptional regulator